MDVASGTQSTVYRVRSEGGSELQTHYHPTSFTFPKFDNKFMFSFQPTAPSLATQATGRRRVWWRSSSFTFPRSTTWPKCRSSSGGGITAKTRKRSPATATLGLASGRYEFSTDYRHNQPAKLFSGVSNVERQGCPARDSVTAFGELIPKRCRPPCWDSIRSLLSRFSVNIMPSASLSYRVFE